MRTRLDRMRKYEFIDRQNLKEMSIRLDTGLTDFHIGGIDVNYGLEGCPQFVNIKFNGEWAYYIYTLRFMAEDILTRAKEIKHKFKSGVRLNAGGAIQYIFGLY